MPIQEQDMGDVLVRSDDDDAVSGSVDADDRPLSTTGGLLDLDNCIYFDSTIQWQAVNAHS